MASPVRDLLQGKRWQTDGNSGSAGGAMFEPDPKTWADPKIAGGGYGHAQLSHSTGMLCWLTGLMPKSVFARMSAPDSAVDLYDALSVSFEGGAIGTVSGAGTVPPSGMSGFQVDLRIFGRDGLLMLDLDRFNDYQCESATFRMNVALSELPDFTVLPGRDTQPHHGSGVIIAILDSGIDSTGKAGKS
jgi:predicted dehydrogenase